MHPRVRIPAIVFPILFITLRATAAGAAQQTNNAELWAVPAPGKVVVDGKLDDWDLSGEILICYDLGRLADVYSAAPRPCTMPQTYTSCTSKTRRRRNPPRSPLHFPPHYALATVRASSAPAIIVIGFHGRAGFFDVDDAKMHGAIRSLPRLLKHLGVSRQVGGLQSRKRQAAGAVLMFEKPCNLSWVRSRLQELSFEQLGGRRDFRFNN